MYYTCTFYLFSTEESNNYQEYATEFTNLTVTSCQLMKEKHKLDTYSLTCVLHQVTNTTRIALLLSPSNHKGILTSLVNILVNIHNSFITAYAQLSPECNRYAYTI